MQSIPMGSGRVLSVLATILPSPGPNSALAFGASHPFKMTCMKRCHPALLFLALDAAVPVSAATPGKIHRADPTKPFAPLLLPSVQPAAQDFYDFTLGTVGPNFDTTDRLYVGQRVRLLLFAYNYAVSEAGAMDLTYDLTIEDPLGKKVNGATGLVLRQGNADNPQMIPFPATFPVFSVKPGDPTGNYTFIVTVHDRAGGEDRELRRKITVIAFQSAPLPEKFNPNNWTTGYFAHPQPELALPALTAIGGEIRALAAEKQAGAWPPTLGFYDALLADNPWLVPFFAKAMHQATGEDQRALVRVLGYALRRAEAPPAGLTKDDWAALAVARAAKWPDADAPLTDPSQLDLLWGRFFATGAFAPVQRILSTLEYHPYLGRMEEYKKSGRGPDSIPPEAMKELVLQSALWSFHAIGQQRPLVLQYGEFILERQPLDDPSKLLLAQALGHEVRVAPGPNAPPAK